ncbi:MAG TPA: hypothetical protein VFZ61_32200 [Polyangiales bacterium]
MRTRAQRLLLCAALLGWSACGRLRFEDLNGLGSDDSGVPGEAGMLEDAQAAEDGSLDADPGDADWMDGAADAGETGADGDIADASEQADADASDAADGAGLDAAADAGTDAASDAGMDAAADAGPDAAAPRACGPGLTGPACDQCVRYVDLNSSASQPDGLTWQTAFRTILAGESAAYGIATSGGPSSCQVWVREGRYFQYVDNPINGLAVTHVGPLYGGFAGTEVQLSQRNLAAHTTIIDGANAAGSANVVNPVYASGGAYLDGFTVTGGRNTNTTQAFINAGGLDLAGGTTTLRNMLITGNTCTGNGAGLYAENTTLVIEDSRIVSNVADGSGGGLALGPGVSALTLRNVVFSSNVAGGDGGAVHVAAASPLTVSFANVVAAQNVAGGRGGAFYMTGIGGTLTAVSTGTNTAGGSAAGAVLACSGGCTLINSLYWDVSTLAELALSGTTTVQQSIVRGAAPGLGPNVRNVDPQYVSASDLHLGTSSPAIDAAEGCSSPERDLEGRARVDVTAVTNVGIAPFSDLGAYEAQLPGARYETFTGLCP